jgi:hypothetical protein
MSKIVFSDEDVKLVSQEFRNSDEEKIRDFLDEIEDIADRKGTALDKNEILDLILGKPEIWDDFVPSLDLFYWRWDKGVVDDAIYEKDDFYVIKVESQMVAEELNYIYDLRDIGGKGVLMHWGEFAKVDDIGNIYVVVAPEDERELKYITTSWFGNEDDAIDYMEETLKKERKEYFINIYDEDGFIVDGDTCYEDDFPISWTWECKEGHTHTERGIDEPGEYKFECEHGDVLRMKIVPKD